MPERRLMEWEEPELEGRRHDLEAGGLDGVDEGVAGP